MNKFKKLVLATLVVGISMSSFAYNSGTYKGEAAGYGGKVEVEVKVSKDKIEDIKVLPNKETPFVSSVAVLHPKS